MKDEYFLIAPYIIALVTVFTFRFIGGLEIPIEHIVVGTLWSGSVVAIPLYVIEKYWGS